VFEQSDGRRTTKTGTGMNANGPEQVWRSLARLRRSGAGSRVWDVAAHTLKLRAEDAHAPAPFQAPLLNKCLILKHRIRAHERDLFDDAPTTGTKVVLPFTFCNLGLGGRSIFVGERRWAEALADFSPEPDQFQRDADLLEAVAELPSLDPYLLREHLDRRGFELPAGYFDISRADQRQIQRYCIGQIEQLVDRALGAEPSLDPARAGELLLGGECTPQLEPLRRTLQLDEEAYAEGMFCWRGFLYYKWVLGGAWPGVKEVVEELGKLMMGGQTREARDELRMRRERLLRSIAQQVNDVRAVIRIYDNAYASMVEGDDPGPFREFLARSPALFPKLGELAGGITHITSYWRYRFPAEQPKRVGPDEMLEILIDFDVSLACDVDGAVAAPRRAA
jgi:hypothetical protein